MSSVDNVESQIDNLIDRSIENMNIQDRENAAEEDTQDDTQEMQETGTNDTNTNTNTNTNNSDINIATNIEGFNTALHQYLEIEEEVKVLLNAIKLRNQKKKQLGISLSTYLRENKIRNVNLGGTYKGKKLESVVVHKATGFNKVSVTDAIYNELKDDEEIFGKLMEAISKKSVMQEIWKIKISSEKVSKEKKEKNNISMAEELLNEE